MTKKKKVILSLVAVVLALAAYGCFFGVQTVCAVSFRMMRQPQLDVVPRPMTVDAHSEPVTVLKAFDYSFSVPWPGCNEFMSATQMVCWSCSESNFNVVCFSPQEEPYSSIIFAEPKEGIDYSRHVIDMLELGGIVSTNYNFCLKAWNITPKDVSIFDSKPEAMMKSMLLLLKAIGIPGEYDEAYFFEQGGRKGFQIGVPSKNRSVHLNLFDQMDRKIDLVVFCSTNSPVSLTQADINTIITTFSSEP